MATITANVNNVDDTLATWFKQQFLPAFESVYNINCEVGTCAKFEFCIDGKSKRKYKKDRIYFPYYDESHQDLISMLLEHFKELMHARIVVIGCDFDNKKIYVDVDYSAPGSSGM